MRAIHTFTVKRKYHYDKLGTTYKQAFCSTCQSHLRRLYFTTSWDNYKEVAPQSCKRNMKPSECGSALYRGQVVGCDLVKVQILIPYLGHKTSDSAFLK